MKLYIYHHNDFDGVASAAIFSKYIEIKKGVRLEEIVFYSVDYDIKKEWPDTILKSPNAVLDFLYHHNSDYWFDHHIAPFLPKCIIKKPYIGRSEYQYSNSKFLSCPSLIVSHFYSYDRAISLHLKTIYKNLITWSDIIDGAKYNSPSDLYGFDNIYMNINKTLALCQTNEYIFTIIKSFFDNNFNMLKSNPAYQTLIEESKVKEKFAIETISNIIEVQNNVAFFDQSEYDFPFQRYLAYYLHPNIYYRVAIFKKGNKYSISVNYNNWLSIKNKVNLGKMCNKFGGGGRFNVGGIIVDKHEHALIIANNIRKLLQNPTESQLDLF